MEDAKILQLYWDRNEAAIKETAERYGDYCHSVASNILSSPEDCEECVNDTYLRAWNGIPPQRPKCLGAFLAKITRNLAFDRYKAQTAQKRNKEMECILDELDQCISTGVDAEDCVIAEELRMAVNRFVKALPQREANVFIRRYFFAESPTDIGRRYSLSAGNVAVILTRTRQKLKAFLEKEGYCG